MDTAIEATENMPDVSQTASQVNVDQDEPKNELQQQADNSAQDTISVENENLKHLCSEMFQKVSVYLNGEVENTVQDYLLLENMNKATISRYNEMHDSARMVGDSLHQLNQKFSDLQPYLEQIESIEQNVMELEKAAYKLDAYSKRLEERFKKAQKQTQ